MKKGFFLQSLVCLLAVSCSVHEMDTKDVASYGDDVFYASLESSDTRVYLDEDIKILWDKDDLISIFNLTTQNQQYKFDGKTGQNAGTFSQVTEPVGPEEPFPFICAVYPYQNSTIINKEGILTLTLPEEQVYREGSFGPGANTMVSSTQDHLLKFKNLGGFLVLKLYGRGVSVSSVSIEGHKNEPLSGKATLKPEPGVTPTITMDPTAGKTITLNCETPVELGATKDDPTLFWMVVPPTSFTEGFKLTVTDSHGRVFVKETSANLSVNRNEVLRISAIKVKPVPVNYAKASSITAGGTYLIVDAEDKRLFKGAVDGSYVTVNPDEKGVITDNDGALADYEFTVENSGSNYYLMFNDGKYIICNYVGDNGPTGLYYVDTQSDVDYPYTLTTGNNGAFFFNTTQKNDPGKPNQYLYHNTSSNVFKIGGSGNNIGVHLYKKDGKLDRSLRFDLENVICTPGSTPDKPELLGTYTTVSFSSSDENIATVDDDGNVTPLAAGTVTITASVEEDEQYSAGTASYTLEVRKMDRGMSFNPQKVTCTLDGTPEKPVLSGKYTTVTYSSSNSKIATVDADGNVSPHAMGIVTITAHADEDGQYEAGSASYTLRIKSSSTFQKYVRVTSADQINLEGEYVIVYENGQTQKVFKPVLNAGKNAFLSNTVDNAPDVSVLDNEIEASTVEGCQFMLANQDGTNKKFSLLVPEADGTTDYYFVVYGKEDANSTGPMTVFFASPTATGYRSTFNLSPAGVLTINGNSGYNFQYSSSGYFTAATGSSSNLSLFVRAEGSVKQKQNLSFALPTVTWALGDDYAVGNSYAFPQEATGAQTTVTYTCEPESVAKIENGRIKIVGPGSATVTATAAATDVYYSATATYTLRILRAAPGGWVDLGSFNLENEALTAYLNDAELTYTDTNDDEVTVMNKYVSGAYSSISRKDCPKPVTIDWTNPASNATVIKIYENDSLGNPVWTQNATVNSTAAEVYNLIPGRKYYYSVSENGTVLEKGFFNTTGRRRMIKVSDSYGRGYANNCRDLGGLIVSDHGTQKTIKYGYMFRGTNMDLTTQAVEWPILLGFMNVGMDIDLRNGNASSQGSAPQGNTTRWRPLPETVAYTAPGFMDSNNFPDLTTPTKVHEVVMAFFDTVKSGKATYFHCYSGADRTGYIAMLIEGLLGVSEKDCSIDYELTSFSVSGGRYRIGRVQGQSEDYDFRDGIAFLRGQTGGTFQEKIENYLTTPLPEGPGISQTDIDEFKSLVLK